MVNQTAVTSMPSPDPILLTPREAAELLRLCAKTLYLAEKRGELRAVRLGRSLRYRRVDLDAWIQSKLKTVVPA